MPSKYQQGLASDLSFININYEKNFNSLKVPFQLLIFRVLTITLVTLSSAIFCSNPLSVNLHQICFLAPFVVSMGLLSLLYYLTSKYFREKVELVILVTVLVFILGSGEIAKFLLNEKDWSSGIYWIFGINLQTGSLFPIIARIRWTRCALVLLSTQTYIWFRILDLDRNQSTFSPAVITFCVYAFLLPLLSYAGEREDRKLFQDIKLREDYLNTFQNLIKEVLPSAFIILHKSELLFFNEKVKDFLRIQTSESLNQRLREIKVFYKIAGIFFLIKSYI